MRREAFGESLWARSKDARVEHSVVLAVTDQDRVVNRSQVRRGLSAPTANGDQLGGNALDRRGA